MSESAVSDRHDETEPNNASNMENLYQEWTLSQDRLLWENRDQPVSSLAALLGRGLRGTEQRLVKLRDVQSTAYERVFAETPNVKDSNIAAVSTKLVPASEVLRRIQWDAALVSSEFSVLHFDRVDNAIVESPMDASNDSISGKATRFVDALPEHRIVGIKYKERVVWDRHARVDLVFGHPGIRTVLDTYNDWKQGKDIGEEQERQRRVQVSNQIEQILGQDRFGLLSGLSNELIASRSRSDASKSAKLEAERYVQSGLDLFRQARNQGASSPVRPVNDEEALELWSEFVATQFDSTLGELVLVEIALCLQALTGQSVATPRRSLPELDENDLTETFVRGSGPGGQKVNKTSNRVVLVHEPTQLRVECQETRSLPQNRKLARQRLREKLDDYLHGQQSKANLAAEKAASKKAKVKARNRARQRQRENSDDSDKED